MTQHVTKKRVELNSVNLTPFLREFGGLNRGRDEVENTSMADDARSFLAGLRTMEALTLTFAQSYAAGGPHQTLSGAYAGGTVFEARIRMRDGLPISATNPEVRVQCFITGYNDGGSVGELATVAVTLRPQATTYTEVTS